MTVAKAVEDDPLWLPVKQVVKKAPSCWGRMGSCERDKPSRLTSEAGNRNPSGVIPASHDFEQQPEPAPEEKP